jgi:hypothetical protein
VTTGLVYSGPIELPHGSTTVNAIAYAAGVARSAVSSATYQIVAPPPALTVVRGGYVLNRRTNKITQNVSVQNTGTSAVVGPIYLVLDTLSVNTALTNSAGVTANTPPLGSPYVLTSSGILAAGASVSFSLEFAVPASGGITYTTRVLAGATP